jgi:hypothetical protein
MTVRQRPPVIIAPTMGMKGLRSQEHLLGLPPAFSKRMTMLHYVLYPQALPRLPHPPIHPLPTLSDPRTFRSMTASTNQRRVLSIDIAGGLAHIAQVPTPVSAGPWFTPHVRNSSLDVPLEAVILSRSRLYLPRLRYPDLPPHRTLPQGQRDLSRLPNTPHITLGTIPDRSLPPLDNASVLTLASSAFGIPGARIGANALSYGGDRSIIGAGDSISHISGLLGDDERLFNDGEADRDVDASVRALRPRSSRRGSWESGASGWSAAVTGQRYRPKNRSLWTSNSTGTGDGLTVDGYGDDDNDLTSVEGNVDNPIPGTANLSIADTVSEITDDGKTRDRSNTVTANDKTIPFPVSDTHGTSAFRSFAGPRPDIQG